MSSLNQLSSEYRQLAMQAIESIPETIAQEQLVPFTDYIISLEQKAEELYCQTRERIQVSAPSVIADDRCVTEIFSRPQLETHNNLQFMLSEIETTLKILGRIHHHFSILSKTDNPLLDRLPIYFPKSAKKFYSELPKNHFLLTHGKLLNLSENRCAEVRKLGGMRIVEKTIYKTHFNMYLYEPAILSRLNHPHIIKLLGASLNSDLKNVDRIYTKLMRCSLDQCMYQSSVTDSHRWIREILSALDYLDSKHIIHGDIKPQNFIISHKNQIKMIDFGDARYEGAKVLFTPLLYRAPEVFNGKPITPKVDIWSFGIMLYKWLGQTSSLYPLPEMYTKDIVRFKGPAENGPTQYDSSRLEGDLEAAFRAIEPDRLETFDPKERVRILIGGSLVWNQEDRQNARSLSFLFNLESL